MIKVRKIVLFFFGVLFIPGFLAAFEKPTCDALAQVGLTQNSYETVLSRLSGKTFGFIGPPGAGKGTAASALAKITPIIPASVGDMLREIRASGSDAGKKIGVIMDKGDLVPSDLLAQVYQRRFSQLGPEESIIVDGAPRKHEEISILVAALNSVKRKLDGVFYYDTSKEVAKSRQQGRRVCPKCKASFHIEAMPPKQNGICDGCGTSLVIRPDDSNEVTILHRHEVFESEVAEIVRELSTQGLLFRINSNGTSLETMSQVYDAIINPDKYRVPPPKP